MVVVVVAAAVATAILIFNTIMRFPKRSGRTQAANKESSMVTGSARNFHFGLQPTGSGERSRLPQWGPGIDVPMKQFADIVYRI